MSGYERPDYPVDYRSGDHTRKERYAAHCERWRMVSLGYQSERDDGKRETSRKSRPLNARIVSIGERRKTKARLTA